MSFLDDLLSQINLSNYGSPENIDAMSQSIYDKFAQSGVPGYDPSLVSGIASGVSGLAGNVNDILAKINLDNYGSPENIDAMAQTIYDQFAQSGVPGYDPSLVSGIASGVTGLSGNINDILKTLNSVGGTVSGLTSQVASGQSPLAKALGVDPGLLSLLGGIASAGIGAYGANQQGQAYKDIANQYLGMGQPYRDLLQQSYQPGFSMANQPDFQNALQQGSDAASRSLSTKFGNPALSPTATAELNKYVSGNLALPQLNTYRSQLGTFGQLGTNQAGSAQQNAIGSQGQIYGALGSAIGQATTPRNSLEDLLKQLKVVV